MKLKILKLYLFTLLMLFVPSMTRAQETSGGITGKVTDGKKEPSPGASITLVHLPTGTNYFTVADKNGHYSIRNIRIGGPYRLKATMVGLQEQVMENLQVKLGDPLIADITLADMDNKLSEVVVKATRQGPRANSFGAGQNISRNQIKNMPTISRSLQDMTRLVPQGSKDNSFGGNNFRYNNVTIDGAANNDAIGFSPSMGGQTGASGQPGSSTRTSAISLDAIEDVQVYLAPYDVKIGNFTGGSVNAVTRSGTNTVSGSAYYFNSNPAFIGKDKVGSLGKIGDSYSDNIYGFRIGFPIIKNKLFFFSNEEFAKRTDPVQLLAGLKEVDPILTINDAQAITSAATARFGNGFDIGTAGLIDASSKSYKFFNRLDWNINDNHQLSIRNNTILSEAINIDRDQQDFRFGSMAYQQVNNQSSTVAELKSRWRSKFSNSLVVGYSFVHDRRDPQSDPSLPQVQITGRTPGTTIYLGTDREASVFNMKQGTLEISNNLTYNAGKHTLLFGTHNEFYHINYGFVNSWNGRIDYLSIADFINNNPYRVRGTYNYENNSRDYHLSNGADFNVNLFSLYAQDEFMLTERFRLITGIRADLAQLPQAPGLSDKVKNAMPDQFFGNTYLYTPLSRTNNDYLSKIQISPRVGIRYDVMGDSRLILRGGAGFFTGRIPYAWLAYAYYNNGIAYGSFDQKADQKPFSPGSGVVKPGPNGIGDFIAANGTDIHNPNSGKTQVDLIDNNFTMPMVMRSSFAADYTTPSGWKLGIEGIYTKTLKDVKFQQVNIKDDPHYFGYDVNKQQPVFNGSIDPAFSNAYLLSNTTEGYRYSITGSINKSFTSGLNVTAAYTYGQSKDISNGIRNSMESNWQLNQALNPNEPGLANSNFDIRHRIIANAYYTKKWNDVYSSSFGLFISAQSGSPFTYGIVNYSIQGLPQQVSLAYIPKIEESQYFFKDEAQAVAFNNYISNNSYLNSRRGQFTERNAGRTPWNVQADFNFSQEFHPGALRGNFITFTANVINLTNLISSKWGVRYFSPNTFNSTAGVGLLPSINPPEQSEKNYPVYTFADPGKPYSVDYFGSRYQIQLGLRYTF